MNVDIIIQVIGFYIISSIGIYKFLLICNVNNPTVTESIFILISLPYYPLMWIYDRIKIFNIKYKRIKYIKQIKKEINSLEILINNETNKIKLKDLNQRKNQLEYELYILELL